MGADQSRDQVEGKQEDAYIAEHYEPIGNFQDPRLGEVLILKNKHTGKELAVKSKVCLTKEELEENMIWFEQVKSISHPNILKILDIRTTQDEGFCSQTYVVKLIFEYISMDLQQEALSRVNFENSEDRQFFEEHEIVHMLQDIISGLNYLKLQQIFHGDVTSRNVLISEDANGQKIHKLHIPQFEINTPKFMHYSNLIRQQEDKLYISPELLDEFGKNVIQPTFDQEKSEIFSVGIIGLQMALLEETNSCYDLENFIINEETVQVKLQQIADKFSPELGHILIHLLETDPEHRATFQEALDHIGTHPYAKDVNAQIFDNYYNESPDTQQLMRVSQIKQPAVLQEQIQRDIDQEQLIKSQQQQQEQEQQLQDNQDYIEGEPQYNQEQDHDQQDLQNGEDQDHNQYDQNESEQHQQHNEDEQFDQNQSQQQQYNEQQQLQQHQQYEQEHQQPQEYQEESRKRANRPQQQVPSQQHFSPARNFDSQSKPSHSNQKQFNNDQQLNQSLKNIDQMVKEALGRSEDTKNRFEQNQQLRSFMREMLEDELFVPQNASPNKKRLQKYPNTKGTATKNQSSAKRNEGWRI